MATTVTLCKGETVFFPEKYSRKADKAYWGAFERVTVEREDSSGQIVRETREGTSDAANQALILALIERVTVGESGIPVTKEWIESLDFEDYLKLLQAAVAIRREVKVEKGKKNS